MGRREKELDPAGGPVQRFAVELRRLRQEAGAPTYRVMAQQSGYSAASLATAVGGEKLPTLAVALAYVTACGGNIEVWERRWHQAREAQTIQPAVGDEESAEAPYRGLARYEPGDSARFFGRAQLTGDLFALTHAHRCVMVFGPSGSGKSSLLRAGLIPRLQNAVDAGLRPAAIRVFTPGPRPMHDHEKLFAPAAAPGETWLMVDQFEELFTLCTDPHQRARFLELLATVREPDSSLRAVLGVRADFLARCLAHPVLAAAAQEASLLIGPMAPAELREAIVKPATAQGLIVERALTARLIEETGSEPGGLPLLSHALLETWRRRHGRTLSMEAYEAAGAFHGAIARTAEDIYARLDEEQAVLARRILLRVITPGEGAPDTRRPTSRAELDFGNPSDTELVLERLAQARLITLDDSIVDLAHEALITSWPRLRAWIEEDRERLRAHRRLTEAAQIWQELDHDPGALYRGTRLATTDEYFPHSHHDDLTSLERDFLTASTATRDQEHRTAARATRRLRRFTVALSVLLAFALTAGVFAWQQSRRSDQQRDRAVAAQQVALSRQLAAQSASLLGSDPDLASLLAVQAHRTSHTTEAATSLYAAADLPLKYRMGNTGDVTSVAFSPGGRTLASGDEGRTVRLWDVATGKTRTVLTGHGSSVTSVAFSPDGRTLATGSYDESVRLWDVATGKTRTVLTGHGSSVTSVAFSPDGRTLATGSIDRSVRLWDVSTGTMRAALTGHDNSVTSVAFGPDGRSLVSGSDDQSVRLWDVASGKARTTLTGHGNSVTSVMFSPDGETVATGSYEESVRLWDVATGKTRTVLTGHGSSVTSVAFSPDGRTLATGSTDQSVRLWDVATGKTRTALTGHSRPVTSVAFSPDGNTLATGSTDRSVRLWDVATGKTRTTLTGHDNSVTSVAFSPDGRTLATGSTDQSVQLWDVASGRARRALTGHRKPVTSVAFSSDGRTLASGDEDRAVRLWDVASGETRTTLAGAGSAVVFSPDGLTLATSSLDNGSVELWDVATGKTRTTLTGHSRPVTSVAFSPDGNTLATGSTDRSVRLWNVALPTLAESVDKICRAVHRDLTSQERSTYLPGQSPAPVCPS